MSLDISSSRKSSNDENIEITDEVIEYLREGDYACTDPRLGIRLPGFLAEPEGMSRAEQATMREHVKRCPACSRAVGSLEEMAQQLREVTRHKATATLV